MARSLALSAYLAFTRSGGRFAERTLQRRLKDGKEDPKRLDERRGRASAPRPDGDLIWFHAASVGESLSILELIRRLGEHDEYMRFLVTTGTITSAEVLQRRLPASALHQFVPLDVRPFVTKFLDHWSPDVAVWTESELWPTMMTETAARDIPMLLVNGRMSQKSYRRWRFFQHSAGTLLKLYRSAHVQDAATERFLAALGMPAERIEITGTLKEGSAALPCDEEERTSLVAAIGNRPTWLAASTHEREEEAAAEAHDRVLKRSPRALLVLAPRHPERGDAIADLLRTRGWRIAQRSKSEPLVAETQVYLADTLGEMGLWYRLAPVSFVGGSLVDVGGHNPFEPAALGSAILHGPHLQNFCEIYARLSEAGAAEMIRNGPDLGKAVERLFAPDKAAVMAHAAWQVCSSGAEVTDKALQLILETLDNPV